MRSRKSKKVTVRLPGTVNNLLEQDASRHGTSKSWILTNLLLAKYNLTAEKLAELEKQLEPLPSSFKERKKPQEQEQEEKKKKPSNSYEGDWYTLEKLDGEFYATCKLCGVVDEGIEASSWQEAKEMMQHGCINDSCEKAM